MFNFLTLFSLIGVICFSTITAQNSFDNLNDVKKVINIYFEGATNANIDLLKQIFHPVCVLRWSDNGRLMENPRDNWFEWLMANGPFQRENTIEKIDVTGNAAAVKVICDLPTAQYVDYISLLKIEGEWKIVAKIFEVIKK